MEPCYFDQHFWATEVWDCSGSLSFQMVAATVRKAGYCYSDSWLQGRPHRPRVLQRCVGFPKPSAQDAMHGPKIQITVAARHAPSIGGISWCFCDCVLPYISISSTCLFLSCFLRCIPCISIYTYRFIYVGESAHFLYAAAINIRIYTYIYIYVYIYAYIYIYTHTLNWGLVHEASSTNAGVSACNLGQEVRMQDWAKEPIITCCGEPFHREDLQETTHASVVGRCDWDGQKRLLLIIMPEKLAASDPSSLPYYHRAWSKPRLAPSFC